MSEVDHSTLTCWVLAYAPMIERRLRTFRQPHCGSVRVDGTYIKIRGEWRYLYRAIDKHGQLGRGVPDMQVEVISDLSRLEALEEQWHALARDIACPMVQFEWIISAAQVYGGDRLYIVIVQEAGVLLAAAPFVLRRYGLTRRLESLDYKLYEPQRSVARDERCLQLLFKVLRRLPHPFILREIPAHCRDVQCFRAVSGPGLGVVAASYNKDSFIPFDDLGRDLEKRMSASRRKKLRQLRKVAERHGPVQFTILRPPAEELPGLLDEIFRVESSGWKGKAGTGLQQNLQQASFFRMYCDRMARGGFLRLGFMTIGEVTAAVRLEVVWGNKSWEFKIGYDERFADCSPGLLLSHEVIKRGQAEGLHGHHFLGLDEPWHDTWAADKTDRVTLRYYPTTVAGGVALLQDAGYNLARYLMRQFRVGQYLVSRVRDLRLNRWG